MSDLISLWWRCSSSLWEYLCIRWKAFWPVHRHGSKLQMYLPTQYFQQYPLEQPQFAPELNATMNSSAKAIRKADCLILNAQNEFFQKKCYLAVDKTTNWETDIFFWECSVFILIALSSKFQRNILSMLNYVILSQWIKILPLFGMSFVCNLCFNKHVFLE